MNDRIDALEKRISELEFALARQKHDVSMRESKRCPACGCGRVYRSSALLVAKLEGGAQPVSFSREGTWVVDPVGKVRPWMCADCGRLELCVNPAEVEAFIGELVQKKLVEVFVAEESSSDTPYR